MHWVLPHKLRQKMLASYPRNLNRPVNLATKTKAYLAWLFRRLTQATQAILADFKFQDPIAIHFKEQGFETTS